jgi:hypothetical protein
LAAGDRRNTLMEWLVNMTSLLEAPNYSRDHDDIFTYHLNMGHRENEAYTVIMNHYHGEDPDQFNSAQHMITDIIVRFSQNDVPRPPIKIVPRIILSKGFNTMPIKSSVSMALHHCGLALISWNSKESTITPTMFGATMNFMDQIINQRKTLKYNGEPNRTIRCGFGCSEAVFLDGTTSSSSLKRTHNASTHLYIKELIASKILGYNLINDILNSVDKIRKQWNHQNSWNHMKSLLFYYVSTNNLLKPLDERGENVKIIVGYTKFDISTTIHWFQINISAFERYISFRCI